jgi:hypothetical protein
MNRRDAERIALALGATVDWVRRTGERRMVAPSGESCLYNGRRKDVGKAVTLFLKKMGWVPGSRLAGIGR